MYKVEKEYYEWLLDYYIDIENSAYGQYDSLLWKLFDTDYFWILKNDENRALDGLKLRQDFAHEYGWNNFKLSRPCSVLEMLIALAHRCEEDIMQDPSIGDRTPLWFWTMIQNLGLKQFSDSNYDEDEVEEIIFKFLNRKHARNGVGSIFHTTKNRKDYRRVELWYQMSWYLDDYFPNDF